MRQKAEESALAVVHVGGLRVTPDTGSPIEEAGIVVPSLPALQSASVIAAIAAGRRDAGAGMAALSAVLLSRSAVHPLKPSAHTVTAYKMAVEVQRQLDDLVRTLAFQET